MRVLMLAYRLPKIQEQHPNRKNWRLAKTAHSQAGPVVMFSYGERSPIPSSRCGNFANCKPGSQECQMAIRLVIWKNWSTFVGLG